MADEASAALENLRVADEAESLATPTGSLGSPTGSYDVEDDAGEEENGISAQLGEFLDSSGEYLLPDADAWSYCSGWFIFPARVLEHGC